MATTTQQDTLAIELVDLDDKNRAIDVEHVDNLAASIKLRGLITPVTVKPLKEGRVLLVAGYHRYHACLKLGLDEIAVTTREQDGESGDRAAENLLRKDLDIVEEAEAVQAMLDQGYTPAGAAQVLGMTKQKVTARAKILELPEASRELLRDGYVPVGAVDTLLTVQAVSVPLCERIADALMDAREQGDMRWGQQLLSQPGFVVGQVLRLSVDDGLWGAYLDTASPSEVESLKLGKRAAKLLEEAEQLHRKLDRYAFGPPTIRFADAELDQARAAGVLLELGGNPILLDRALYRELLRQALKRTVEDLRARVAEHAEQQQLERREGQTRERTPLELAERDHRADLRALAHDAHGVNLDLGAALWGQLATVDCDSMDVARFFAYGVLGPQSSHLMGTDNRARVIAANGLRFVLGEHRSTETPTRKDGKPGATKVSYGDVAEAEQALWRFVDGAKTARELLGRTLCVVAAQHYAMQVVVAQSQRRSSLAPTSKDDRARKALEKLVKPVLPGSYRQLQRALDNAARDHAERVDALRKQPQETAAA